MCGEQMKRNLLVTVVLIVVVAPIAIARQSATQSPIEKLGAFRRKWKAPVKWSIPRQQSGKEFWRDQLQLVAEIMVTWCAIRSFICLTYTERFEPLYI